MSRKQTIIKDINAMQGFGSMDVLCMDKTGTPVSYTHLFGRTAQRFVNLHKLVRYMIAPKFL